MSDVLVDETHASDIRCVVYWCLWFTGSAHVVGLAGVRDRAIVNVIGRAIASVIDLPVGIAGFSP